MANRTEQAIDAALHQPQQRSLTRQGEYVIKVTSAPEQAPAWAAPAQAAPFDAAEAQRLSDRAVDVLRAAEARELPPRIAAQADFYLCRVCPYAARCWEKHA